MQSRILSIPLLLLPLLAAACAPAVASSAAAPDRVTARRAGSYALDVNASRPSYAYVLEVRPDHEQVVQLLNGGEATVLARGSQRIALTAAAETGSRAADARFFGQDRGYCAQGERMLRNGGLVDASSTHATVRPVTVRGKRAFCVRDARPVNARTTSERQDLLLLASPEPIDPGVLDEALAALNARFASARRSSREVLAVTQDVLRERGVRSYVVRVR